MSYKWALMNDIITQEDRQAMADFILTSDRLTNGPKVREFEEAWNEWLGSSHSLYVQSGSTANLLLIAAVKEKYNLQRGDRVLLPMCTWMTTVAPVMQLGLTPVWADINTHNYSFDIEKIKDQSYWEDRETIKIVFVTHLLGLNAEIDELKYLFPNAVFIEDVCESHGVTDSNGQRRGKESLGATFSFYFGHHMSTIEGGMVSTCDEELYDLMRMKRSHGMARESINFEDHAANNPQIHPAFLFMTDGFNCRNDEVHAVLGIRQLTRLDDMIKQRKENYKRYLSLIDEELFYVPSDAETNSSFCFPFVAKDAKIADELKLRLETARIESRPVIGGNLLRHPFLRRNIYNFRMTDEGTANLVHENGIYVGNSHEVGDEQFELLEEVLKGL